MPSDQPYRPVRALNRGLAILQEMNRRGPARPSELARATGLDRTTTYRLLATLEDLGLVRQGASGEDYGLTPAVKTLSDGFTERDRTTQIVAAHLGALFQKVIWPTDFATFDRGAMVIRETTHRFSPYSVHRAMVGQARPLFGSALGRAALAGAPASERARMLEIYRGAPAATGVGAGEIEAQVEGVLSEYAEHGYSWSVGGSEGAISAIGRAVRIPAGGGGAINLVFFRSAMSVKTAAARYLDDLKSCAARIEASLDEDSAGLAPAAPQPDAETTARPAIQPGIAR